MAWRGVAWRGVWHSFVLQLLRPRWSTEQVDLFTCVCVCVCVRVLTAGRIGSYVEDSAILLQAAAVDPFVEVKVLACDVIRLLAQSLPDLWKVFCVAMVRRLMGQLTHRHARIRVAILDAIDACVRCEDKQKCRGAGSEVGEC